MAIRTTRPRIKRRRDIPYFDEAKGNYEKNIKIYNKMKKKWRFYAPLEEDAESIKREYGYEDAPEAHAHHKMKGSVWLKKPRDVYEAERAEEIEDLRQEQEDRYGKSNVDHYKIDGDTKK